MRIAAISVKQPWAELIARGDKPVEFRGSPRHYRGPLLVHASRRLADRDWPANVPLESGSYVTGVAVCIVRMVDCRFLPGRNCFGWFLENPVRVEPFEMNGNLYIFSVPLPRKVLAALPADLREEIRRSQPRLPRVLPAGQGKGSRAAP